MERIRLGLKESLHDKMLNQQIYPQLGIGYLGAFLLRNGFSPLIVDCTAQRMNVYETVEYILHENPLFVGIYVNSFSLFAVRTIICTLKSQRDIPVLVGGPHVSSEPFSVKYLGADFGICGEGERRILDFANQIYEENKIFGVPGLISKDGFVEESSYNYYDDLEGIFPLRPDYLFKKYRSPFCNGPMTTIITSRGCPFKCIFCASSKLYKYRRRSFLDVFEEIRHIIDLGYTHLQFQDDNLNISREWLHNLCELIIKHNIHRIISWDCNLRLDLTDEEQLRLLSLAGCKMIRFGVETADYNFRKNILKKDINNELLKNVIRIAKKYNIKTLGYFMLGFPGEDDFVRQSTLNMILSLGIDYFDCNITKILPGTVLYEVALKENIISRDIFKEVACGKKSIPLFIPHGTD
ncbi:MAG: B12-binding domain-containing radical SAM protein, partial [Deltaproteobacteria bacterium]|nr:B12-binding domain-containing radical SAM protein [Deltaproteobacteria bacterium]